MWTAPNNVVAAAANSTTCAKNAAGAMPVARKLWLMPVAELSNLRAKSPAEQCHRA
jgi:hypothetical protein